jgi:branched-chain amino acid transport system ATP-binding protein
MTLEAAVDARAPVDRPLDVLLRVKNLKKRFGGVTAVNDVSFDLVRNEILAVVGPNGAGKTTLFGLICGFIRRDAGEVWFDGRNVTGLPPHQIAKLGMVRSFQIVQVFPDLTVHETVATAAMLHLPLPAARLLADEILEDLDIADKRNDLAASLPIQSRKRLELAKCAATRPKLIILDEVMAGLTLSEADVPIAAIRKLRDRGITFLMVEHVMPVVMKLADRMLVLNFGELIMQGTPAQVMAHPEVQDAYLGAALDA